MIISLLTKFFRDFFGVYSRCVVGALGPTTRPTLKPKEIFMLYAIRESGQDSIAINYI